MLHRRHTHAGRTRLVGAALLALLLLAVNLTLLPGCESTPAEPEYNNPFDPDGPLGGDPFQVWAEINTKEPNTITIWWNQPLGYGITTYELSISDNPDSNWQFLAGLEATEVSLGWYDYADPEASTATHWFRVQAKDDYGNFTLTANTTPGSVAIGPWVTVASTYGQSATRYPLVRVAVTRGDSLRVAMDPDFTLNLVERAAPAPGDTAEFIYDLGPATSNDDSFTVFVQSHAGTPPSEVSVIPVEVQFRPNFQVEGSPASVATRLVDLEIPDEGVVQMRFANSEADLAAATWVPGAPTYPDFLLTDTAARQSIWGEFEGDFGFVIDPVQLTVLPDLLTTATFRLLLPENRVTDETVVRGVCDAVATHMRYSESPNFATEPWIAYADTVGITLSPGEGRKNIYVQYRNDWVESAILTDFAIYVSQPADVRILAPEDGDVVIGGSTLQVQGTSSAGSGAASVDEVMFDAGDGNGFQPVTGIDTWSTMWEVPEYVADTPVTLRARAWVGEDSVTTVVNVTVTQMAVRIDDPLDGAELLHETEVVISGRAASIRDGVAIEKVEIEIGGEVQAALIDAEGTNTWTATWTTPTVTAILNATITARAYAGSEVVSDQIAVTVAPVVSQ